MRTFQFLAVAVMFAALSQAAEASQSGDAPPVPAGIEAGVYYLNDGKWLPLPVEPVEWKNTKWKTRRAAKRLAATAIGKGGLTGSVRESGSPFHAAEPLEILVSKPDNAGIEQYQLLHLRAHRGSREFNPGTGAASHGFGGTDPDQLTFASVHAGPGIYRVTLSSLPIGEYGFLVPPATASSSPASSIGKIYTFRVTAAEVDGATVVGWHLANQK